MLPVRLVSWCPPLRQPSQLDCILMWRDLSRAGQGQQGHARHDGRHVVYRLRRDCERGALISPCAGSQSSRSAAFVRHTIIPNNELVFCCCNESVLSRTLAALTCCWRRLETQSNSFPVMFTFIPDTRINPAERRIFVGFQLVSDSSVNYQQLLDNEPVYEANVS